MSRLFGGQILFNKYFHPSSLIKSPYIWASALCNAESLKNVIIRFQFSRRQHAVLCLSRSYYSIWSYVYLAQKPDIQYSTVQYSTVYSISGPETRHTVQFSTVQCSTIQYSTVQYSTVQYLYCCICSNPDRHSFGAR